MPAGPDQATPLHLLFGDDDVAIKQKAKVIFEKWTGESGGFDQERISGSAANTSEALRALEKLREALETLPFFGTKVIWFQNCNFLGTDRTSDSAAVTDFLASLAEELKKFDWKGVRLLITADDIDKRKSFYKTIAKLGAAEELNGWSVEDRDWMDRAELAARQQLRAAGKNPSDEAFARLINDAGLNNRHLSSEIEKLILYVGARENIEVEDIAAIVSRTRQSRAFALADALGARDLPKLVRILDNELHEMRSNSKKSEIGVLFGLLSKVRTMLLCKELVRKKWVDENADQYQLKSQLARIPAEEMPADKKFNPATIHPFTLQSALRHSRNYSMSELVAAMEALLQANLQLVSTTLDESIILQQTLIKIVQPAAVGPPVKNR